MAIIILCLWSPSPKHRHDVHHHRLDTLISIVASLSSRQLLLPRLSLPLSDKVKHYSAIALHTIKRQPYGSCQLPITLLQNMIISYNNLYHIMLDHITSQQALRKQVRRPLLCCCKFYVASSKNRSYLRIKTTTIFRQVCYFNLQQGLGVATLDSTEVGETDTHQPPMCKARR